MITSAELEEKLVSRLLGTWKAFVSDLEINYNPSMAISSLEEFSQIGFQEFKDYGKTLINNAKFRRTNDFEDGMNSPGILWDRLTILNCKCLFTARDSVHFKPNLHNNLGNVNDELISVTKALQKALPARNILLAKEATDRQHSITPLEDSLWALQMSNIAMWINQDLLYTVSADDVEPQRLRDYIQFFSKANRIRNTAIENIELFYTHEMQRN